MANTTINPVHNPWTDDDDDDDDDEDEDDHDHDVPYIFMCFLMFPLSKPTFTITSCEALPKGLTGCPGVARGCACR